MSNSQCNEGIESSPDNENMKYTKLEIIPVKEKSKTIELNHVNTKNNSFQNSELEISLKEIRELVKSRKM